MTHYQASKASGDPVLACEMVVIVEVIHHLPVLYLCVVYVTRFRRPLQIVKFRPNVVIFSPTPVYQSTPQLVVSSLYDEYFLACTNAIFAFPRCQIRVVFFLLLTVYLRFLQKGVIFVFVLAVLFGGGEGPGFVLEASELFIGELIEIFATFVLALVFDFLEESFFDFGLFEGNEGELDFFALEEVKILITFGEEGEEREELVAIEVDESGVFGEFCFDSDFGPVEEGFFFLSAAIDIFSMWNIGIFFFELFLADILEEAGPEGLLQLFAFDEGGKFIGSCIVLLEFGGVGGESFEDSDGLDDVGGEDHMLGFLVLGGFFGVAGHGGINLMIMRSLDVKNIILFSMK